MRREMNGRTYNTATAGRIASARSNLPPGAWEHWEEHLYRKADGSYFLHGKGGPRTRWAKRDQWDDGENIVPLETWQAKQWLHANSLTRNYPR